MKILYYITYVYHRFFRFIYRRKGKYQSTDFEHHHHKMKHYKGLLLVVLLLFLFVKPTTADFLSEEDKTIAVADILHQSVVKISVDNGTGTGFYISPDEVITNNHVTHDANLILLTKFDGSTCLGVVKHANKDTDLSLIYSYCDGTPLKIAQSVKVGQSVLVMGNPLVVSFFLSKGIVSSLQEDGYVLTDAWVDHGNSGSPMVNLNGEVVGVIRADFKGTNIGAAVNIKRLNQFMKED